ncbi:glycerophosphodiester phosphodiesterase [Chryseobacterium arachidis]
MKKNYLRVSSFKYSYHEGTNPDCRAQRLLADAATDNRKLLEIVGECAELEDLWSRVRCENDERWCLVVNHDEHHAKMEISETDFKELKKVKLSNGEDFPTLKDYLKQGKKDKALRLVVEIKPDKTKEKEDELTAKTIKMIKDMKLGGQCDFISFSLNICKEIKKLEPSFKVQYLKGELSPQQIKEEGLDGIDYHFSVFQKNPTWIADAKALGLITNAWTVNDVAVADELKKQGIGFITTNIPDQLKK